MPTSLTSYLLKLHKSRAGDITISESKVFHCRRYHNSRMINYDQSEGVSVEVTGVSNKSMKSVLTLNNISMSAAGAYSCSPSMAR